jgi:transposase
VWGAISYDGPVAIKCMKKRLDSKEYIKILRDEVINADGLKEVTLKYMHDNWAVHNATVVREFLGDQPLETIDWPAFSPDLNPIENMWGLLKDRVWAEAHTIESEDQLIRFIKRIFMHDEMIKKSNITLL